MILIEIEIKSRRDFVFIDEVSAAFYNYKDDYLEGLNIKSKLFCQTHNFSFLETYVNSLSGESFDSLAVEIVENHPPIG